MLMQPGWKQIADTLDLITCEQTSQGFVVRIEARKNDRELWEIFKTYVATQGETFTEEYHAKTRQEAQYLVTALQKEKLLNKDEIVERRLDRARRVDIRVKRQFKEYNVEKWAFCVDNGEYECILYLREAENIEVNIIMPEKYRSFEKPIIMQLHAILGLELLDLDLEEEIYYYTTRSEETKKGQRKTGVFVGKVEMGVDFSDKE